GEGVEERRADLAPEGAPEGDAAPGALGERPEQRPVVGQALVARAARARGEPADVGRLADAGREPQLPTGGDDGVADAVVELAARTAQEEQPHPLAGQPAGR